MYLRVKTYKNKDGSERRYLFLVATKRMGGRVRQVTVANLGRLEEARRMIPDLVKKLAKFSKKLRVIELRRDMKSDWVKEYGLVVVFRRLWDELGIARCLEKHLKERRLRFKAGEIAFALVLNRLLEPRSELATHEWVKGLYGVEPVEDINQWYRTLDVLIEHKDKIEQALFSAQKDLFNQEVDMVLMDTTSVVYWGDGEKAEEILAYGYSKEKRSDLKQVIVGILMTREGIPIGHEVYPGNTNDINAFRQMIRSVGLRFRIRRVIIVCDRGMVTKKNLEQMERDGYEYVVGMRMRQLTEEDAQKVLDAGRMRPVTGKLKAREVKLEGRRLVACYNPEQAERDRQKREEIIRRLVEKLKKQGLKSILVNKEYSKYLKIKAEKPELDEERIEKEALFDGKFVLETNTKLNWKETVIAYKGLWQVEKAFRTLKNELEIGPIYHYTERRIRAHIFICFLALMLRVRLHKALRSIDEKASFSKILEDIKKVKAVGLDIQGSTYILRTELQGDAHLAFKAAGLKIPPRIISAPPGEEKTVALQL